MGSLGSLGTKHEDVDVELLTFDYFGTELRVDPNLTEVDLLDFLEGAEDLDTRDAGALKVLKDLCRSAIHPEDFDRFWALAREHRQGIEDRMAVALACVEAAAARPTQPSSVSSGGPSATATRSEGDSFSQVRSRLAGRPDLQLVVDQAEEASVAASRAAG